MNPTPSIQRLRGAAMTVLALPLLSGCVSLLPASKPVQTYLFGSQTAAPTALTASVRVLKGVTTFPLAAGGDRILTVTGTKSAYIAGARWVAPASVLFDQAVLRAFDAPDSPRLVDRGEPLAAPSILRLDVRTFEVRYPGPEAVVQVRASLTRHQDHALIAESMFEQRVPAAENRQSAIVDAFDKAVNGLFGQIRDWTASKAP